MSASVSQPIDTNAADLAPQSAEKPVGQWTLVWRRLRHHKLAMIGLVVLAAIVMLSLLAQWIAPYSYEQLHLHRSYAPFMAAGDAGRAAPCPGHRQAGPRHFFATAVRRPHLAGRGAARHPSDDHAGHSARRRGRRFGRQRWIRC